MTHAKRDGVLHACRGLGRSALARWLWRGRVGAFTAICGHPTRRERQRECGHACETDRGMAPMCARGVMREHVLMCAVCPEVVSVIAFTAMMAISTSAPVAAGTLVPRP